MLWFEIFLEIFLMIPVTVIDFTQGVGMYFIPSPTLSVSMGDGAKSLIYTYCALLYVDITTIRFYIF
jgi:hypothetical protein